MKPKTYMAQTVSQIPVNRNHKSEYWIILFNYCLILYNLIATAAMGLDFFKT